MNRVDHHQLRFRIELLEYTVRGLIQISQALILCAASGAEPQIARAQHLIERARALVGRTH